MKRVLPALSLKDQHDKPVAIPADTRWLLFSTEKPVSDMVASVLSTEPAGAMARMHLVYVVDLSAMPGMVKRMFALPKLRKLPFAVGLVQKPEITAHLPRKPGEVTLITLEQGRVQAIGYLSTEAALLRSLGIAAS